MWHGRTVKFERWGWMIVAEVDTITVRRHASLYVEELHVYSTLYCGILLCTYSVRHFHSDCSSSILSREPPLRNLRHPYLQLTYYVGCRDIGVFALQDYEEIIPDDEEQMIPIPSLRN